MESSDQQSIASKESQNSDLWKKFGRESDVGKMLYSMYGVHEKPKIQYPPVKTKPRQANSMTREEKKCPQKTVIEYPEPKRKPGRKYHAIDFVPRRKAGDEIIAEMEYEMKKPLRAPGKTGVNRKEMIRDLQERFQFKNKEELEAHILQQKQLAMLPPMDPSKKKRRKYNMTIAQKALQHYQEKYGQSPLALAQMRPKTKEEIRSEQDEQLEDLFESVVEEIEERQEHLDKVVQCGGNKEIETRLKHEIVERVAELQKIREMQSKQ